MARFKTILVILTCVVLAAALAGYIVMNRKKSAPQGSSSSISYETYVNVRFAYSVCYAPSLFIPQGEAADGDGQKFLSRDGHATVFVYGSNATDQTLQQDLNQEAGYLTGGASPATIVQKSLGQNSFTISAQTPAQIIYEKTLLQDNEFKTIQIQYDKPQAPTYQAIVTMMVDCFVNTSGTTYGK